MLLVGNVECERKDRIHKNMNLQRETIVYILHHKSASCTYSDTFFIQSFSE